ncbi:MAG: Gfo/Idh/MocA family oxidoreductase [Clostridia bacterium]|nr:Gfo/Idh/MocA family oxidoreductase [Clostridia bacterium]
MKHGVGFIGYGHMGSGYHYQVAEDRRDAADLVPVAVYDVRQSQRDLAVERGLKAYDDLDKFLSDDEFDVVVVATPNNFHREMTCRALEAGKHVICEKPAAMTSGEIEEMIATSERTGKKLFIHQNRRFDVDFLAVKHAYDTGRLGKIHTIESNFCGGTLMGCRAFEDHAGGILFDWGVHLIDQIVYLIDEPVKSVWADVYKEKNPEVDDRATVIFTFEGGTKAKVTVSGTFLAPYQRFAVYGEKGVLWMDDIYEKKGTFREAKSAQWKKEDAIAYGKDGAFVRQQEILEEDLDRVEYPDDGYEVNQDWAALYTNMIDTIDGKAEMLVRYDQVRTVFRIIEAAFESSKTGKVVEL